MRLNVPIGLLAGLVALTPVAARAQQSAPAGAASPGGRRAVAVSAPAVDPAAAEQDALQAAEDLAVTRVIAGLRLTAAQMRTLLPVLEGAQAKLKQQEHEAGQALAPFQPRLAETRRALIAGKDASTRAEGQIAEQIRVNGDKRRQLRSDLVSSVRRQLSNLLASEQQPLLASTARSMEMQQRTTRLRIAAADVGPAQGSRGNSGGGPIGWVARQLDQARGAAASNYDQERIQIAMRLANPDRGRGNRGQTSLSSTDPSPQQLAPYLALMDRLRQMPDAQYQQQRADLALQALAQGGGTSPADAEAQISDLIDRYFLSPRMVSTLQERLSGRGVNRGERER
jgi:hypothetical protein